VVTQQQGRDFVNEIGAYAYMECSALTRYGLSDIFETAVKSCLPESLATTTNPKITKRNQRSLCVLL